MKKIITIALCVFMMISSSISVYAMDEKQPTYGKMLFDLGLIKGDDNNDLKEDSYLTRTEMVVILNRLKVRDEESDNFSAPQVPSFTDVPKTHWAYKDVEKAYALGVTSGLGEGIFGVNDQVTYQQAVAFMMKVLEYDVEYASVIETSKEKSIYLENNKNVKDSLLRSEVFELIAKTLITKTAKEDKKLLDLIPTYSTDDKNDFYSKMNISETIIDEEPQKTEPEEKNEPEVPVTKEEPEENKALFFDYKLPEYDNTEDSLKKEMYLIGLDVKEIVDLFLGSGESISFDEFYSSINLTDSERKEEKCIAFEFDHISDSGEFYEYVCTDAELYSNGSLDAIVYVYQGVGWFNAKNPTVLKFGTAIVDGKNVDLYYIEMDRYSEYTDIREDYKMFILVDDGEIYKLASIGGFGDGVYVKE